MSYRIRYYSNSEYEYRRITMASFSYSFVAVDDQSFRIVMEHVGLGREDETNVNIYAAVSLGHGHKVTQCVEQDYSFHLLLFSQSIAGLDM